MFNWSRWPWTADPAPPAPRSLEVVSTISINRRELFSRFGLRPNMWVIFEESSPGILLSTTSKGTGQVMLTNSDGTNLVLVDVYLNEIRQAEFDEIPLPRRPTEAVARAMGYRVEGDQE